MMTREDKMTYQVFLVNFGYSVYRGPSLAMAIVHAKKCGFEAVINSWKQDGTSHLVAHYSPINGLHVYEDEFE